MIRVTVNNRDARATPLTPVTSGAVGLPVHFSFSEDWLQEGLTRIACFHVPEIDTIYSMILDETNETVVPWELLVNHGRVLFIGAYAENAAGTLVIPTIWANAGMIELGTQDGEQGAEPTPTQWAQIRELAEEAAASAAVAEGYAEHGPTIINGYWCTWDGEEYVSTGQAAQGPAGQDGADGTDGVSPAVTITPVTGGTAITITDKDHPSGQSFNVLNGQDGAQGPTGPGIPAGGSAGQFYRKASSTDYDGEWHTLSAGDSSYDSSLTYSSGTVGQELSSQRNTLTQLDGRLDTAEDALSKIHAYYNANTDSTVESNRTTAMQYLLSNVFNQKGSVDAIVRYLGGYYHLYHYFGTFTGAGTIIVEYLQTTQSPYIIYWSYNSITWQKYMSI